MLSFSVPNTSTFSVAVGLFFLLFEKQLLHVPLGDSRQLETHICFVDGDDIFQFLAHLLGNVGTVPLEILNCGFHFPAAFGNQPLGRCKVVQRYDGSHTVILAEPDHLPVMLHFCFVELALHRLDPRPLDGETVAVQTGIGQKLDIFFVPVVVVHRIGTGLREAG